MVIRMPITVQQFRELLKTEPSDKITKDVLLSGQSVHVADAEKQYIQQFVGARFAVKPDKINVFVVGSAHLGFSISKKRISDGGELPRYRSYGPDSDIDIVIISEEIYSLIWSDLSLYSHTQARWPWDARRCGDYHVCGWLRPDKFPIEPFLMNCNRWKKAFGTLSTQTRFGRRRVNGGLFQSMEFALRYYQRAVDDCKIEEEYSR
jgi:hypothetical protein